MSRNSERFSISETLEKIGKEIVDAAAIFRGHEAVPTPNDFGSPGQVEDPMGGEITRFDDHNVDWSSTDL